MGIRVEIRVGIGAGIRVEIGTGIKSGIKFWRMGAIGNDYYNYAKNVNAKVKPCLKR